MGHLEDSCGLALCGTSWCIHLTFSKCKRKRKKKCGSTSAVLSLSNCLTRSAQACQREHQGKGLGGAKQLTHVMKLIDGSGRVLRQFPVSEGGPWGYEAQD